MKRPGLVLGALTLVTVLAGCASSTPLLSERDRCTRFGGLWEADQCRQPGGGGGGM